MKRTALAAILITGMFVSPAAFAGQRNVLGQWVPTSTEEGRSGWTAVGPTEELAGGTDVSRSSHEAAGFVRPRRETRYRIDALGHEVPIQTNLP
jgi:hypothetical protein